MKKFTCRSFISHFFSPHKKRKSVLKPPPLSVLASLGMSCGAAQSQLQLLKKPLSMKETPTNNN